MLTTMPVAFSTRSRQSAESSPLDLHIGVLILGCILFAGCATAHVRPSGAPQLDRSHEMDAISRAQVWRPTNVAAMDLRRGPGGAGSFPPNATITCRYVEKDMGGSTPKFACARGDDELRIKYGRDNGEVFAEVAATRLLWALGFGADRVYPVRVICQGCPGTLKADDRRSTGDEVFDYATVERKMSGLELFGPKGEGWAWSDLDRVNPTRGGAPQAHRDALKLLAVILQHTDSKREQQRLACLERDKSRAADCAHPFMLIDDVGKTFGKANEFNRDKPGSVNLKEWKRTPVWQPEAARCVGNLPKSFTGTLENPVISEAGRRFLAERLKLLTDRQMHDLFDGARFKSRDSHKEDEQDSVDEWVDAFKKKIADVVNRDCSPAAQAAAAR